MKKLFYLLTFMFIIAQSRGQNALQSAEIIQNLKHQPASLDPLLKEVLKYVETVKGAKKIDLFNPFNFKSDFLKGYMDSVLSKSTIITAALSNTVNINNLNNGNILKDSLRSNGIDLTGTFNSIIKQLKDTNVYRPSSHKTFKLLIDSLYSMSRTNFSIRTSSTSPTTIKFNSYFKSLIADTKVNLNTNNVFEIQSISALKGPVKLPSESDIVDALAIFLVSRVKEESVIAFVEHVNKNIDKLQPLPCLFKNTVKELAGYTPGQAAQFGSITQKAIALDLAQMPDNIVDCGFCNENSTIKKHKDFTDFFDDISVGVDFITNIGYYADKEPSDKNFNYVLKLLNFVNKYYSNIQQKDSAQNTWIGPDFINIDEQNDTILKLSLALIYEKDKPLIDTLLKTRFKINNLNDFFLNKVAFKDFKGNFKELFYSLHRLDSYWQSHRSNNKAIVDMTVYKRNIARVFEDVHNLMHYPKDSFALNNTFYTTYLKAKAAVSDQNIQDIIFHSQQLLDLLNCYEIKLPGFKLPNFDLKINGICTDGHYATEKEISQYKGDSSIKITDFKKVHDFFTNPLYMSKLSQDLICTNTLNGCRFFNWHSKAFNWAFNSHKNNILSYNYIDPSQNAMIYKFHPWKHPFMFSFHHQDWKFAVKLNGIRKLHLRQLALDKNPNFMCFVATEKKLQNKNSYSGSRREVSKLFNFFTDVAKAKDGQLSQIIEKYAEPAQSYRIKRYNHFSWDINAYPGIYTGVETRVGKGNQPYSKDSISNIVSGITAPVGISFSWAGRTKYTCNWAGKFPAYINKKGNIKSFKGSSFSTSLIILDIGAVVSYRFSHDTSKALPKTVNFSQVIAPGFFFGYGIPRLPLIINAGIQYTPQLRTFNNEGGKLFDTYRIAISLCYDIPILNIANTTKKSQRAIIKN